mgnify:CR=1 FL=1
MNKFLEWGKKSISPVFIAMFVAAFIMWYITKLSYTYTTEQTFRINIDGEKFEVTCVVEGIGTNLFGYRVYHDKSLRIPLSELRSACSYDEENYGKVIIEPQSLQNAISVRCTDIKIISIGDVPEINQPKK